MGRGPVEYRSSRFEAASSPASGGPGRRWSRDVRSGDRRRGQRRDAGGAGSAGGNVAGRACVHPARGLCHPRSPVTSPGRALCLGPGRVRFCLSAFAAQGRGACRRAAAGNIGGHSAGSDGAVWRRPATGARGRRHGAAGRGRARCCLGRTLPSGRAMFASVRDRIGTAWRRGSSTAPPVVLAGCLYSTLCRPSALARAWSRCPISNIPTRRCANVFPFSSVHRGPHQAPRSTLLEGGGARRLKAPYVVLVRAAGRFRRMAFTGAIKRRLHVWT